MNNTIVGHTVTIGREGGYATANPNELEPAPGDTLHINSKEGKFRVVFEPWPFKEPEQKKGVTEDKALTFERSGKFRFYCYLTPTGEKDELGYKRDSSGAVGGGHGNVRP